MANPKEQNLASLIISIIILIIVIILIIIVCCGYNNGNYGNNYNKPRVQNPRVAAALAYKYKMNGGYNKNNFSLASRGGDAGMGGTCVGVKNIGHNCFTNEYSQPGHCIAGSICVPNA